MRVEWEDGNGRNISIYWCKNLRNEYFEQLIKEYDFIEIVYPFRYEEDINERYGDLLFYVEQGGRWNADMMTGCINLSKSMDEIFASVNKSKRYDINRAKKDGIEVEFIESASPMYMDEYRRFYKMYNGLCFNESKVTKILENGNFVIGRASLKGEVLVQQGYMHDENDGIVMLYANYNNKEIYNDMRQMVARANEYLLFESISYFKNIGYSIYDCGGMPLNSTDSKLKSIADYKKRFGFIETNRKASFVFFAKEYRNMKRNLDKILLSDVKNIIVWGSEGDFGKYVLNYLKEHSLFNIDEVDNKNDNIDKLRYYSVDDSVIAVCISLVWKKELLNNRYYKEFYDKHKVIWVRGEVGY